MTNVNMLKNRFSQEPSRSTAFYELPIAALMTFVFLALCMVPVLSL